MTMQRSFDDYDNGQRATRQRTIEESALTFHHRNPDVYEGLVALARELVADGHKHFGISMLWETLRYNRGKSRPDDREAFTLNNNYRSRYARMIMAREPDLADVFNVREIRTV